MQRASAIARTAARELRLAEEELKRHQKICGSCHKASKDAHLTMCRQGTEFYGYVELMRRQSQLLKSPPVVEMVQDTLW